MTHPSRYQALGGNTNIPCTQIVNAILGGTVLVCLLIVALVTRTKLYYVEEGHLGFWYQLITISLIVVCIISLLSGLDFIYWDRGQGLEVVTYSMGATAIIAVFSGCFILIAAQNTLAARRFEKLDKTPYDWYNIMSPGTVDWNAFQLAYKCCGSDEPRDWFRRQPGTNYNRGNSWERNQAPEPLPPRYGNINLTDSNPNRYINPSNDLRAGVPIPPRFPGQEMPRQPGPQPSIPFSGQRLPQNNQIPPQFPPNNQLQPFPIPNNQMNNYDYNNNNNNNNIQPPPFPPGPIQGFQGKQILPPSCCRREKCTNSICYCESKPENMYQLGCRTRINNIKHTLDYMAALMILLGLGLAGLLILYSQLCIVDIPDVRPLTVVEGEPKTEGSSRTRQTRYSNENITPGFKAVP